MTEDRTPHDVFLSYSRRDEGVARRIVDGLIRRGLTPWRDRDAIAPGDEWVGAVEDAVCGSCCVVVVVGGEGLSRWQRREYHCALSNEIPAFPIILPGVERIPGFLSSTQAIRLDDKDLDGCLDRLADTVRRHRPLRLRLVHSPGVAALGEAAVSSATRGLRREGVRLVRTPPDDVAGAADVFMVVADSSESAREMIAGAVAAGLPTLSYVIDTERASSELDRRMTADLQRLVHGEVDQLAGASLSRAVSDPANGARLFSTPTSAAQRELSVLACVEVVAATIVIAAIAVRFHTLVHVAVGCALAPLFLLRTPDGTRKVVARVAEFANRYNTRLVQPVERWFLRYGVRTVAAGIALAGIAALSIPCLSGLALSVLVLLIVAVVLAGLACLPTYSTLAVSGYALYARAGVALRESVSHPLTTVSTLRGNFHESAFCTDCLHPHELVPGMEAIRDADGYQRPSSDVTPMESLLGLRTTEIVRRLREASWSTLDGFHVFAQFVLLCARPVAWRTLFRLWMKGTLFLLAPLVWTLQDGPFGALSPRDELRLIRNASISKVVRVYSLVILLLTVVKIHVGMSEASPLPTVARLHMGVVGAYVFPTHFGFRSAVFDALDVALAANALCAWATYLYADYVLQGADLGYRYDERVTTAVIAVSKWTRALLSMYSVTALLYLTYLAMTRT